MIEDICLYSDIKKKQYDSQGLLCKKPKTPISRGEAECCRKEIHHSDASTCM